MRPTAPPLRAALALALLLGAGACASTNEPKELTDREKLGLYFENALRYYNLRDLDRAQHQVQQGLAIDPRNERFLLMLGSIHQLRGTTADILTAEQIFREHPNQKDYRVKLGLAQALERKGVIQDEAAEAIRSGEQYTDAPDPEARADELEQASREAWREAYDNYEESVAIRSGDIGAVTGLMRTAALLGRDKKSIEWGRELIEVLDASSRIRRLELEDVAIEANRERELREAIRSNTTLTVKAHLHIASLYVRLNEPEKALEDLGSVVELDPELPEAYSRRAQLFYDLGNYLKAKDSIEHFLNLAYERSFDDPDIQEAYDLLQRCKTALANADLAPGQG